MDSPANLKLRRIDVGQLAGAILLTRWVDRMGFLCTVFTVGLVTAGAGMIFYAVERTFSMTLVPLLVAGHFALCCVVYWLRKFERRSWFVFGLILSVPVALYVSMGLLRVWLLPETLNNYPAVEWLVWLVPSGTVLILLVVWRISSWRAGRRYRGFGIEWAVLAGVHGQAAAIWRRTGARGYLIASIAAFAAALVAYVLLNELILLLSAAPSTVLVLASAFLPGLLGFGSVYLQSVHNRMTRLSAPQVLQHGADAPVLVLRSFKDDELPLSASRLLWWEATDLIQAIAAEMAPAGPVIAIGNPLDRRPALGPYFHYVVNDIEESWKDVVRAYVERAGLVVFCAGMTEHLQWEVTTATAARAWRDLLILFPPSRYSPREVFAVFARDTPLAALGKILPENIIGILAVPSGVWLLASDKRRLYDYRAAMIVARSIYRQDARLEVAP